MMTATPSSMSSTQKIESDLAKDGKSSVRPEPQALCVSTHVAGFADSILSNPQILEVPLLLLANKQDSPQSLSVEEIRNGYEDWHQNKLESARRDRFSETETSLAAKRQRLASLDVMGVSALEG